MSNSDNRYFGISESAALRGGSSIAEVDGRDGSDVDLQAVALLEYAFLDLLRA